MKNIHILFGTLLIISSLVIGRFFLDDGCGACVGPDTTFKPKLTFAMTYFLSLSQPKPDMCSFVGCSNISLYPIFLDLFAVGIISMFIKKFKAN